MSPVLAFGLVAILLGVWLLYAGPSYPPAPQANSTPWPGWWFPFGWFFLVPVFFLIFFGLRWFFWGGGWWGWGRGWYYGGGYDTALETLRQRYARGEITKEQFEQTWRDLERSG